MKSVDLSQINIDKIKSIISENSSDMAFVIGNGIHRYNNNKNWSWEYLLKIFWNGNEHEKIEKIPDGISFTEFYDIIEMHSNDIFRNLSSLRLLDNNMKINDTFMKLPGNINDLNEIYRSRSKTGEDVLNKNMIEIPYNFQNPIYKEFAKGSELFQKIQDFERERMKGLQYKIADLMMKLKPDNHHFKITERIHCLNIPILTTNYDYVLNDCLNLNYYRIGKSNFSTIHPWSGYFGLEQQYHIPDGFGVWNINGTIKYPQSIKLGLNQYMATVVKARKMIQGNNVESNENYNGKNTSNWIGRNTWLHLIFNKNLFIFGLALEENEIPLRWLLIQRAIYYTKFPNRKYNGWYVTTDSEMKDKKNEGKFFFLKNMGFEIIPLNDYKDIYENIWD